jgi:hypothetical protein
LVGQGRVGPRGIQGKGKAKTVEEVVPSELPVLPKKLFHVIVICCGL